MSRRGRVGRLPRVANNLTSAIVAAAQAMQSQRDRNVMDAWQKGGLFEGKPVSDEKVLAYWKDREKGLDHDDPTYEGIANNVIQLDYGIHQSKQDLLYKQGKISDRQYASFFLNWSKKVPRNSEFWRTLQKDAAQFMQHAAASGRARGRSGRAAAYGAYEDGINKKYVNLGSMLTDWMTTVAQNENLIGKDEKLNKFALKGENDPGRMEHLLGLINADIKARPDQYKGLIDAIRQFDPHFDGQITSAYFARALKNQITGYTLLQQKAIQEGYSSKAKAAGKLIDKTNELGTEVKSWPMAASYSIARDKFDAVRNSPASTDEDKLTAAEDFAKAIDGFAATGGIDYAMSQRLTNDALALRGSTSTANQDSFYENYLGLRSTGSPQSAASGVDASKAKGENATIQEDMARIIFWKQQYDANPGAYVYASYKLDDQGNPTYDPSGQGKIGVVPRVSVDSSPTSNSIVPVPTITGGVIMQVVTKTDVVVDDPFDKSKHTVVGQSITYNVGGRPTTLYGVKRPDGTTDWTAVPPWSQSVSEVHKEDGIHLQVNPDALGIDNAATAAKLDSTVHTNVAASFANGAVPVDGKTWKVSGAKVNGQRTDTTVIYKNGQLLYSQNQVSFDEAGHQTGSTETPPQPLSPLAGRGLLDAVWDQSRLKAGPNPTIDFSTEIMAALTAGAPNSDAVRDIWNNPQFQYVLQQQQLAQAGNDPNKLATIAHVDQGIGNNLAGFGPDSQPHDVDPARASSRQDLLYPSINEQAVNKATDLTLKVGKQLVVPSAPAIGEFAGAFANGGNLLQAGMDLIGRLASPQATQIVPGVAAPAPFNTGLPPSPVAPTPPPPTPMPTPTVTAPTPSAPLPVPTAGGGGKAGASKPGYTSPTAPAPTPSYNPSRLL